MRWEFKDHLKLRNAKPLVERRTIGMALKWDITVYTPMIPEIEMGTFLEDAIRIGSELSNEPLEKKNKPHIVAIFGLACLAVRQARAFKALVDSGLEDQAITIARSLYETYINLYDVTQSGWDRDQKLPTPMNVAEKKARSKLLDAKIKERGKHFWDHHRATNYRTIKEADKHIKGLKQRVDDLTKRMKGCKDHGHLDRMKQLRQDLRNEIAAYRRHKKINGQSCCKQYKAVKFRFGKTKPHIYWNNKSPSLAASDLGVNHSAWYQYCCNFSHSGALAVRAILAERPDGLHMGPAVLVGLKTKLVFMASFLLKNCLAMVARTIGDADIDLSTKVLALQSTFTKTCALAKMPKSGGKP